MPIARDAPARAEHAADQICAPHRRVEQVVAALRAFARDRGLDEVAHAIKLVRPVEMGEAFVRVEVRVEVAVGCLGRQDDRHDVLELPAPTHAAASIHLYRSESVNQKPRRGAALAPERRRKLSTTPCASSRS